MFLKDTLVVLGAGASAEFNLPVGDQLATRIRDSMHFRFFNGIGGNGDRDLFLEVTKHVQHEVREYAAAAAVINEGITFANSIDDFLDVHRTNSHLEHLAKCAIVKQILQAERQSLLSSDPTVVRSEIDFNRSVNTWLFKFVRMLCTNASPENVFKNVSFVVFNYDRCLERFLAAAVRRFFDLSLTDTERVMNSLEIFHPFGTVGKLPEINGGTGIPFGLDHADLRSLSTGIRTYSESVSDEEERGRVRARVASSEQIIFLGFGFHHPNLDYLKPDGGVHIKPMFATASGFHEVDVWGIKARLAALVTDQERTRFMGSTAAKIHSQFKCRELIDAYQTTLRD